LATCGCDLATTEDLCYGPCKWNDGACKPGGSVTFLPGRKNLKPNPNQAVPSGDMNLDNESCDTFYD
jgi:hypothetical protein